MTGPAKPANAPALDRAVAWLTHHFAVLTLVPVLAYAVTVLFDIWQQSWYPIALLLGLPSFLLSFALVAHGKLFCRYCPQLRQTMDAEDVPSWLKLRHSIPSVAIFGAFLLIVGATVSYVLYTFTDIGRHWVYLSTKISACSVIVLSAAVVHASIVHTAFKFRCRTCKLARAQA